MLTKFLRNLSSVLLIKGNKSKLIPNSCWRCGANMRETHEWKRQMHLNQENQKIIPRLVYLHNPWKYLLTKLNLLKFRLLWDQEFVESEFIRGAKQAAAVLTKIIRTQNSIQMKQYTTPIGYQQIARDMYLSRDDNRLRLVRFEPEHLRRAIPMNVATRDNFGHRFCFIDMLFVGLRNTKDFDSREEVVEVRSILRKLDTDLRTPYEVALTPHRIVFAEIFIRFRRNYTVDPDVLSHQRKFISDDKNWSVSFYKILTFDILNYDPRR